MEIDVAGFTSKERDVETGLDYFGARYYESWSGRWMSVDPLAKKYPGWSPYCYVRDNAIGLSDPARIG
jgi:RHS repeat-associated protein